MVTPGFAYEVQTRFDSPQVALAALGCSSLMGRIVDGHGKIQLGWIYAKIRLHAIVIVWLIWFI